MLQLIEKAIQFRTLKLKAECLIYCILSAQNYLLIGRSSLRFVDCGQEI